MNTETIPDNDDPFELLRSLLFDESLQHVETMRGEIIRQQQILDALDAQIRDKQALLDTITPVIAGAIRTNISESRDEMVDALYPIMGKLVQKSVTEAMRELAQRIDQQMRRTLDFQSILQRLGNRLRGVSEAELAMRNALPFAVEEIFLIHRETGLLLLHLSQNEEEASDSDIISGMLTAITEFTEDAFGRTNEESLNEIQYGGRSILLEVAHLVYIAVVIDGFETSEFRSQMRETMIAIEHRHASSLRTYDGDASRFMESQALLGTLLS
ncbi:MAG: hypothetical protein R2932_27070 [Caldilineaceae bacterium]